ncbi:MAG: phosphatidate cytidylyltransferase [Acidobacteria bacterium]|nr:phosphatidate cytidylyltransferase [Acidobacteriota bacterium]
MKRVLTALVLIPVALGLIFLAPPLFVRAALAAVGLLCLREFYGLVRQRGAQPYAVAGMAAGALLVLLPALLNQSFLIVLLLVMLGLATLDTRAVEETYGSSAATFFGVVYTCGPLAIAGHLHALSPHWIFLPLLVSWVGDSAAYYVGRAIGKHKLAPRLSPGKTWEGTIGSAVLGTVAGAVYLQAMMPGMLAVWATIALPLATNVAGQIGDLAESALKRGSGTKDSGHILPGHGGALDRMDGTLFAFPAVYIFLLILGGGPT